MRKNEPLKLNFFLVFTFLAPAFCFAQFNVEWETNDIVGNDIAVDDKGNVYVTGYAVSAATGSDFATVKYNAGGVRQWMVIYDSPGSGYGQALSLVLDKSGNVYITGESSGAGTGLDFATIKYNNNGVQQWVARYNGSANGDDGTSNFTGPGIRQRIAVDASGNVYVTGPSEGSGTGIDYVTIKYNNNGMQQWVARYNGPLNGFDAAFALAIDGSSNVFVTGSSEGIGTGTDYATVKYNSNGVQQWVARYNGPVDSGDAARDIAIDASGNIYVTGSSVRGFISFEEEEFPVINYLTVKYNAAGVQQWEAAYDGPAGRYIVSRPSAVAVDAMGNVYVTGQSGANTDEEDYATVKYTSNGVQLWAARYTSSDFDHRAFAMALDSSANVYVTGQQDVYYATVKYNTDGVQQWVAKDSGGGVAYSIAVDALANVYVTGNPVTIKYAQSLPFCGSKDNKVIVCHKGKKTLCINKTDAMDHIRHGDHIGGCNAENAEVTARERQFPGQIDDAPDRLQVFCAPNPVSATMQMNYTLPATAHVSIKVYDLHGRQTLTLVDATKPAGVHIAQFNAQVLQKGIYFYRITAKSANTTWSQTGKISVIK